MSSLVLRARQMSLALLVMAVVDHGNLTIECSGSKPNSSGLVRLGRDLMRRSGNSPTDISTDELMTLRKGRIRSFDSNTRSRA